VDLLGVGLAQRAAEDPEVMGVDEHRPPEHRAPAGDRTIGVRLVVLQPEPGGPVPAERLDLVERVLIQQQPDALAHGKLALVVLPLGLTGPLSSPDRAYLGKEAYSGA